MALLNFVLHFDKYLPEFIRLYGSWVYAILFTIVFAETGFVVTPFLPGEAPSQTTVNYNKGLITNYSGVLSSTLVNNARSATTIRVTAPSPAARPHPSSVTASP